MVEERDMKCRMQDEMLMSILVTIQDGFLLLSFFKVGLCAGPNHMLCHVPMLATEGLHGHGSWKSHGLLC